MRLQSATINKLMQNWKSKIIPKETSNGNIYQPFENDLIDSTKEFVMEALRGNDASHDFEHIHRVWRLAKRIGQEEKVEDMLAVELGALLHDIDDWKYSGSATAGVDRARTFLETKQVDGKFVDKVVGIIGDVGYKEELVHKKNRVLNLETKCVQDADRLDAIGAIGIARCFTFGGYKKRPLYDAAFPPNLHLTKEEYMHRRKAENTTMNHFYEKLFTLQDLMKTDTGRKIAIDRHAYMAQFVDEFFKEVRGEA